MGVCDLASQHFDLAGIEHEIDGSISTDKLSPSISQPNEENVFWIAPTLLGLDSRRPIGEAAPDIQVTGTMTDRGEITITTSSLDFGDAPLVYLDYDGSEETVNQNVDPSSSIDNGALIAGITAGSVVVEAVGQSKGWLAETGDATYQIRISLPDVTQLFTSFKYKNNNRWPGGTGWPDTQGELRVIPNDSTLKFVWIGSNPADIAGAEASNLCLPSHYNGNSLGIGGNSHNMALPVAKDLARLAAWDEWATLETFVRPDPAQLNGENGYGVFNSVTPSYGRRHQLFSGPVFAPQHSDSSFKQANIPGWIDGYPGLQIAFSDIYLANIPSRFIVGDHPVLSQCRNTSIVRFSSWQNQRVVGQIRVPHTRNSNLYIFGINADGNALSENGVLLPGVNS